MASEEGWVGIAGVAAHLSVGRGSACRCVDSKDFPAHRVGRPLRFRLYEVVEWVKVESGSKPTTHQGRRTTLV